MTKHTPTPWYFEKEPTIDLDCCVYVFADKEGVSNGHQIFDIFSSTNENYLADAAHIVKCVNNYDRLVEIVKKLRQQLYDVAPFSIKTEALLKKAQSLLDELEEV